MENEIWVDIKGYEGLYQISNLGNVKGLPRLVNNKRYGEDGKMGLPGKILKPIFHTGYYAISLYKDSTPECCLIHRLVALHFIPNPENKPEVNHIGKDENGKINRLDNRAISLEWATAKENSAHAWENGLCDNNKILARERIIKQNCRKVIDNKTGIIYNTVKEAATDINVNRRTLSAMLRNDFPNTTNFSYVDKQKIFRNGAILLSTLTGIFYESYREAALVYEIKRSTLRAMVSGYNKNKTDLIQV